MAAEQANTRTGRESADIYEQLWHADPAERGELVLQLLAAHPQGRLVLPAQFSYPAMLEEIDLSPEALQVHRELADSTPAWWNEDLGGANLRAADLEKARLRHARLPGADLRSANLQAAMLGEADLRDAVLEEANLQGADLAGAQLQGARFGEANLQGAMLEEADLRGARLRFAYLQRAVLEGANCQRADFWGAQLEGTVLAETNLQEAVLEEANLQGADLSEANLQNTMLRYVNFQGANLKGANLQGCTLLGTNLEGANLQDARLQELVLTNCTITNVFIAGARLDKTRFTQNQLGGAIGEDLAGDYEAASQGYLALEHNFLDLGDPDASRWAYLKRRRMQKLAAYEQARKAYRAGRWHDAARNYTKYASDQFVEWMCDYGESIWRVLGSMVVVYLLFIVLYGLTNSVVRIEDTLDGTVLVPTQDLLDLSIFSLISMTAAEGATIKLMARTELVAFLTACQTLISIALTGLLGFVLGNRIRR